MSWVVPTITLNFPSILLLESSLSFLGIGVQPPQPGDRVEDAVLQVDQEIQQQRA